MVFMWNATAFPFYAAFAANPEIITPEVNARVLVPQSNSVYKNITPVTAACNYYDATDTTGTWNNKFTSKGKRLTNGETQNLTFPLPSFEYKDDSGTKHSVNVTAADVDRYYEYEKFTAANGYTKISGASLAMNCHGYSTGLGYWMDDFDTLMSDDYTSSTTPSNLAVGAIKGDDSHSIKITEISTTMSGEVFYKVIKTREKFHASGVYEKAITDEKYYENDTVPYLFYTKN
ncbi:MAG: hypothetical protein LBJ00_17625 [Planctomycetaceae bacterium]|jgi:hypothetical protein|nr:hypothetical protein [Planctomycetaceae bacterium]